MAAKGRKRSGLSEAEKKSALAGMALCVAPANGFGVVLAATRLTASYGTAFKAPTFNNLFWPFEDYGIYGSYAGNPNLRPEQSKSSEVGFQVSDFKNSFHGFARLSIG